MRKYTRKEARLEAWKNKINNIKTDRETLKNDLLEILRQKDWKKFEHKRTYLLEENHGQGLGWTPTLSWLWSFISFFLPTTWNPLPGSQLRQALEDGISLDTSLLSLETSLAAPKAVLLEDTAYEDALFNEPASALSDIQTRMKKLDEGLQGVDAGKKELDTKTTTELLDTVFERLHAFKYRLTADSYQKLLSDLFQKHPVETLSYFYHRYSKDPNPLPKPQDFVENQLISQALMDMFVLCYPVAAVNQRIFAMQKLLIVLAKQNQPDKNPLKKLLADAKEHRIESSQIHAELDLLYDELGKEGLKAKVIALLPEEEQKKGNQSPLFSTGGEGRPFDFPIGVLEQMLNYPKVFDFSIELPLIKHIARLGCQELLQTYHQKNKEHGNFQLHSTITFLSDKILGTWQAACKEGGTRYNPQMCEEILRPYAYGSAVNNAYKNAERFANQIIISNMTGTALDKAREIAKSFLDKGNRNPLTKEEINWLLYRIGTLQPNGVELAKAVEYILVDTTFYGLDDLSTLDKKPQQRNFAALLENIESNLTSAEKAHNNFQADKESEATKKVGTSFCHLLKIKNLEIKQLEQAYEQLKRFKPYLTGGLFEQWKQQIYEQQSKLVVLKEDDMAKWERSPADEGAKVHFDRATQYCMNALDENASGNFTNEKASINEALRNFNLFLKSPNLKEFLNTNEVKEVQDLLDYKLQSYLTPKEYLSWSKELKKASTPTSGRTANNGFLASTKEKEKCEKQFPDSENNKQGLN